MLETSDSQSEQSENVDANEVPRYYPKLKRPSFSVDNRENPSANGIPNNEDMPTEKLVSDDAALQASQLTLLQTVQHTEIKLAQIHVILAQHPELATIRMVDFNPTSDLLRSVREAVWNIYNATAKFIGRNSAKAVIADTEHLFGTRHDIFNIAATVTSQGKKDSDIRSWIKTDVMTKLDPDMNTYVGIDENRTKPLVNLYESFSKAIYLRVHRL